MKNFLKRAAALGLACLMTATTALASEALGDRLYCALREDEIALAKWREWQDTLKEQGEEELLSRLHPFCLPPGGLKGWTEYRELRHLAWGRTVRALTEDRK